MEGAKSHQTESHQTHANRKESDLGISPEPPEAQSENDKYDRKLDNNTQVRRGKQNVQYELHRQREQRVSTPTSRHPLEVILTVGLRRLLMWGIPLSVVTFLVPAPGPDDGLLIYNLVHLTVLQIATFWLVLELAPLTDQPWFVPTKRAWLASAASLIAAVVGFSALLTLATTATGRYAPSLQFLQLLSSLDIAWVVAAIYIGARELWGSRIGLILGSLTLLACVGSITLYLQTVGFTETGGWLVDVDAMFRIVISADTVAALLSLTILFTAARSVQRTEQARPHS